MKPVHFTQYMMPDGQPKATHIFITGEVGEQAEILGNLGYRFESEMLSDFSTVSLTVVHDDVEGDLAMEVIENGPGVIDAVSRLVQTALQHHLSLVDIAE